MKERELFLLADAALREVIDNITPDQLELPVPEDWVRIPDPTLLDVVAAHAYDEAWVPDVLAGRTIDEVDDKYGGDLLGGDPLAAYDAVNDVATVAVNRAIDPDGVAHLTYGDFPVTEYFQHIAVYRAFQAWSIAKLIGLEFHLRPELVDALWQQVVPQVDGWRAMGVFGPAVEAPAGADRETQLLAITGYWRP
ncbi:MAG: hypothetical protein JWM50_779 [Microbacteriaceae bacterium]|jgi:hypothetical protein|nr:hypothetical protein [Microbacteriaceae bacterium]